MTRFAGYRAALKAHGIRYTASIVRQGYFDFDSGKRAGVKLLSLAERPTAIIASNDDMAAGVIFEANELEISVPDELSVVGFDDSHIATHLWPPLTTVRQPIQRLGALAVERV